MLPRRYLRLRQGRLLSLLCLTIMVSTLWGAPLPPLGKVDITGTIVNVTRVPERRDKAIRGMSGSAGRDRTFPAHFVVTLKDYAGPTARQAAMMNSFVGASAPSGPDTRMPGTLTVWINSEEPGLLKAGMKIAVNAYSVSGDEGGTWTHHDPVQIR